MEDTNNYRYPGPRPFNDTELDRLLFKGREKEKEGLLNLIQAERLVVLFAKSGIGKTSLLNAGLLPMLRGLKYFPLVLRFNDPYIAPLQSIYSGIKDISRTRDIEYQLGDTDSLWQYFKTVEFWSKDIILLTPVLILDQFEDLFVLHSEENRKAFIADFADLARGRVPKQVWESFGNKRKLPFSETPPTVKILISIREDSLGQLEELSAEVPAIFYNRFRLEVLGREQAKKAIVEPAEFGDERIVTKPFSYESDAVEAMLNFLCKQRKGKEMIISDEVEAFQLQLLCQHFERKIEAKQKTEDNDIVIKKSDLAGEDGMNRIMQDFYLDQIEQLENEKDKIAVRRLCENGFINRSGWRVSIDQDSIDQEFGVTKAILERLVNSRLLRAEPRLGSVYYELSHDTLLEPIKQSKKQNDVDFYRQAEQKFLADSFKTEMIYLLRNGIGTIPFWIENIINKIEKGRGTNLDTMDQAVVKQLKKFSEEVSTLLDSITNWDPLEKIQQQKPENVSYLLHSVLDYFEIPLTIEIEFERLLDDNLPKVLCNAKQLSGAFYSVISNRIRSMIPKGGKLSVETIASKREDRNVWIDISIADTGCGIPPEKIPIIFEQPFDPRQDESKAKNGFGYGLWWAETIINSFGGSIRFVSEVDKGTTFIISLPTVVDDKGKQQ